MKIVFYKELLSDKDLSPNEKIIYSFLIYKSITIIDGAFTADGTELDTYTILGELDYDPYITMYEVSYRRIGQILNISPRSVMYALNRLDELNYINKYAKTIFVTPDIFKNGYFPLLVESKIKGELLIFYSYIKNKSRKYGSCIDTFKYKLAEELHTTKIAITNLLNRLYSFGLAKRLPNGKLQIN